jgi:hypothetical protein
MFKENNKIQGVFTINNIDTNNVSYEEFNVPNTITNEGTSLIAMCLLNNYVPVMDWKFRIGTGRNFTLTTDSYLGLNTQTDEEIIEIDIGSEFFKIDNNMIILNGIVLSNEGFVETVSYNAEEAPRENTVMVGHKLKNNLYTAITGKNLIGTSMNLVSNKSYVKAENLLSTEGYSKNLISSMFRNKSSYEDIKIQTVEIDGWLNDVDNNKKWNNVSLVAYFNGQRYLFSRTVLPPMFKAKGVRQCVKYSLFF